MDNHFQRKPFCIRTKIDSVVESAKPSFVPAVLQSHITWVLLASNLLSTKKQNTVDFAILSSPMKTPLPTRNKLKPLMQYAPLLTVQKNAT
jgi:hypothetical protein